MPANPVQPNSVSIGRASPGAPPAQGDTSVQGAAPPRPPDAFVPADSEMADLSRVSVVMPARPSSLDALEEPSAITVKQILKVATEGPIKCQPVLSDDERTIYVASYGGCVHAFDTATGTEKWKSEMISKDYVLMEIRPEGLLVEHQNGNGDYLRDILDVQTGRQVGALNVSRFPSKDRHPGSWTEKAFSPDEKTSFQGSNAGYVHAINNDGGRLSWARELDGAILYRLAVSPNGKNVYVACTDFKGSKNHVYALDAKHGGTIWRADMEEVLSSPAVSPDGMAIYIGIHESDGYYVHALNSADRSELWKFRTGDSQILQFTSSRNGTRLFVGSSDGSVYALSLQTRSRQQAGPLDEWRIEVEPLEGHTYVGNVEV